MRSRISEKLFLSFFLSFFGGGEGFGGRNEVVKSHLIIRINIFKSKG